MSSVVVAMLHEESKRADYGHGDEAHDQLVVYVNGERVLVTPHNIWCFGHAQEQVWWRYFAELQEGEDGDGSERVQKEEKYGEKDSGEQDS